MMDLLSNKNTIGEFLLTSLICASIFILYALVKNFVLRQFRVQSTEEESWSFLPIIDRVMVLILGIIVLISFILVNPLVHLILMVFIIAVSYNPLSNIILGTVLQQEFKFRIGQRYTIGNKSGILLRKGWTGITLSSQGSELFLSYSILSKNGISHEEVTSSYIVKLIAHPFDKETSKNIQEEIESILFPLPYLIEGNKPIIEVEDDAVHLEIGLIGKEYIESLQDLLNSRNFKTTLKSDH